jgi:cytochrome c oxidase subunit 2
MCPELRVTRSQLFTMLPFALLALLVGLAPLPAWADSAPTVREVILTAGQFSFDPPVLRVNQGDTVRLTLHAADVVHGFYLDEYGLKTRVEPGLAEQVEFTADRPGKFRYRCSVSCGSLHPFMIGELVVNPNWPFGRAVGLTLVAVTGALVYLWRFPPQPD